MYKPLFPSLYIVHYKTDRISYLLQSETVAKSQGEASISLFQKGVLKSSPSVGQPGKEEGGSQEPLCSHFLPLFPPPSLP